MGDVWADDSRVMTGSAVPLFSSLIMPCHATGEWRVAQLMLLMTNQQRELKEWPSGQKLLLLCDHLLTTNLSLLAPFHAGWDASRHKTQFE